MADIHADPAFALSAQQQRAITGQGRVLLVADLSIPIDDETLTERLRHVISRHEVIRSAFTTGVRSSGAQVPLTAWPWAKVVSERLSTDQAVVETAHRLALEQPLDPGQGRCLALVSMRGPTCHCVALVASTLAADGPSLGLILEELLHGPRTVAPIRYAGYASWQADQRSRHQDTAWYERPALDAVSELLDIQLPLVDSGASGTGHRRVHVADGYEAATVMCVRAAWAAFLARLTASDQILLGHVTSGRDIDGLDTAVGPYARMLPLVLRIDTHESLDDLSSRAAQEELLPEMAHRFDWRRVGERLDGRRFVFGFTAQQPPRVSGASIVLVDAWPENFTVAVSAQTTPDGVLVELVHDRGQVSDRYGDALAAQFGAFLAAAIASPTTPVGELNPAHVHGDSVITGPEAVPSTPILERIRGQAETTPDRPAVRDALGTVLYGALLARAESLADLLRVGGVGNGTGVVTLVGRDRRYPIVALAAMMLGAVFVPVDPVHAASRVRDAVADGLADVVVVFPEAAVQIPPGVPVVEVEADGTARWTPGRPTAVERAGSLPGSACYVMFTSGSAGAAKPVAVADANLAAYCSALTAKLGLGFDDRVLHSAPLGFSSSIRQTLLVLAVGGLVVIASDRDLADAGALLRRAADERVTVLDLVPSVWRRVHDAAVAHTDIREALRSRLRLLLSASEPLSHSTLGAITELAGPRSSVINMYGQTETTGIVTTDMSPCFTARGIVPLGTPLPGVTVAVLDAADRPVPLGTRGTIHVIGPTLALGYPHRQEETDGRFREVSLHGRQVLAYDTGDVGMVDLDGRLLFCGRRDDQVKIRGFRVELAEVDAGLALHPAVQEAAAITVTTGEDRELVGYIVPRRDQRPTHVDLVSFLSERIPAYLIPSRFITVTALPLLPTGKVDRSALTEAASGSGPTRLDYVAPRTPTEKALAVIWSEVLEQDGIGVTDNFFELGGHSLRGIDMLTRVLRHFGVAVPWTEVFQLPTVAGLAARIEELAVSVSGAADPSAR